MHQATRPQGVLKFALFLSVALTVCAGGTAIIFKGLRIEKILIEGEKVSFDIDESRITRNLLFFPTEKVRLELLRTYPLLKDIQIQKIYPSTLKFVVTKRIGIARLVAKEQQYILDSDAFVIGTPDAETKTLPPLYFDMSAFSLGSRVDDERIRRAVHVLQLFPSEYAIIKISEADERSIWVKLQQSDIFFPQDGDITGYIHTLQTLFVGFKIKGALPSHIDLRFGKPIVR
jgi:cell division septal protein FtsQ